MSILINRLILNSNTAGGAYGADITFSDGLFILRVENTHGKSTCINSIAYALGMEMALGQQNSKPPFPPSLLKSIQDKDGTEHLVISSFVMLQISNNEGRTATLKRNILGADADSIICVFESDIESMTGEGTNFFLHKEGDTTRELGFYNWLVEFFGWELPSVPNNYGKESPLYPALIFPLFFIEQKKGWGSIQATTPFHLQIIQAKKRAFEFLMDLDINEIVNKKAKNKKMIDDVKEQWKFLFSQLETSAIQISGKVLGIEEIPKAKFSSYKLDILLEYQDNWQTLTKVLEKTKIDYQNLLATEQTQTNQESNESQRKRIQELNKQLILKDDKYEYLLDELSFIRNQVEATEIRIENLTDDKRKYEDLKKVKSYKLLTDLPILNNECPTCGKEYSEHSVELECSDELMTLEESLNFIKNQILTFKSVLKSYSNQLDIKTIELSNLEKEMDLQSEKISRLKEDIYSEDKVIDEEFLREKIRVENQIKSYEEALINIAYFRSEFDKLHERHQELKRLRRGFPEHGFSAKDNKKILALQNIVIQYLTEFGFSSFDPKLLSISKDSYLPTREGFDLGFDISASDGIRVIWSYLISLFSLSKNLQTYHPGILIFDEPRQQEANKFSFTGLLRGASQASSTGQIIFATSEEEDILKDALKGCDYNLCSFSPSEGKILRKL